MHLIDSCALIDLTTKITKANLHDAVIIKNRKRNAALAIKSAKRQGRVFSPDIVYAEVSAAYDSMAVADRIFEMLDINVIGLSRPSLFKAARAFVDFRNKNKKLPPLQKFHKHILPDFYIGACAEVKKITLITRDGRRAWEDYFPSIQVKLLP